MASREEIEQYLEGLWKDKHGGPAHPLNIVEGAFTWAGMTMRDAFAMHALPAVIQDYSSPEDHVGLYAEEIADNAYTIADAMIAHRRKTL